MEANLCNVLMNVGAINSHVNLALSINMGNQALIDAIRIVVTAFCEDEVLGQTVERFVELN